MYIFIYTHIYIYIYIRTYIITKERGWRRKLSWLRHWVGDPGNNGKNHVTAITFTSAAVNFPAVDKLQCHQRPIPLIPCLYGVGG